MKNKLIISTIIGLLIAVPSIGMALKSDKQQVNNNQTEGTVQEETPQKVTEEVKAVEPAQPTTAPEVHPDQLALPLEETTTTPIDVKKYAQDKFNELNAQGQSGMNYGCFDTLMQQQYEWDVSTIQIDDSITKIRGQYPSTCAALAAYKETGSY